MSLSLWYHVSFDEEYVYRNVKPPKSEGWKDQFQWKDIIRICFRPGAEHFDTDELYIFTNKREESYLIPLEADGGSDLWGEIIKRNLYDTKLAIKVASALEGLYCWPDEK